MFENFRKKDFILLLVLILFIIVAFFFASKRDSGKILQVKKDNEVIQEIDLSEEGIYTFENDNEENIIQIENNTVNVISANCYNQICVNTAPIHNEGEVIACLPHGLIFEIIEE